MPVQYLVKHIAFQEERECRILKAVSDINNTEENIQSDGNIFSTYITYEVPLTNSRNKPDEDPLQYVIIHEKQKTKAPYFHKLLKKEVKISSNPYRR